MNFFDPITFLHSFADIARNEEFEPINNPQSKAWNIAGDDQALSCDQEFTLILKSDENKVFRPRSTLSVSL